MSPVADAPDSPTFVRCRPARSRLAAAWPLLLLLFALLLPRFATASRPVIGPGREAEILELLAPHEFGDELAPGWTLHSFSIDQGRIILSVAGPEQRFAQVFLDHPDHGPPGARALPGFAVSVAVEPEGSEAAVAELLATVERNDAGEFWRRETRFAEERPAPSPWPELEFKLDLETIQDWARDGLVLGALFTCVLLGLVAHKLAGAEPWMKWALLAIVAGGALLRLTLSPAVALAPWPYTRLLISARLIYHGLGLALIHPGPVWLSETILTSTLALSLLAPLALYVHARYLLDDHRAALIVAAVVAVLPLHLRFSHSDAAFIPSITVSSTLFTLIHVATRSPSKPLGWFAVAIVGFPLALVYLVRPLNIMYYPLLIATAFVDHGVYSVKPAPNRVRVGVAFAIVTAVTAFGGVPWLLEAFAEQVSEGLSIDTLLSAFKVLLSPRMNILLNPVFTPPGLTLLAGLGAVDLWRRGKRPLFWFLTLWLFGFLAAHAYTVPSSMYMQARYHLHLIVPYMLLVACGIEAALRWLASQREQRLVGRRYPAAVAGLIAYVLASPLIHLHGIRYVGHNEPQEWLFVHGLREQIPAQCTVVEYVGRGGDSRFGRVGAYITATVPESRWQVLAVPEPQPGEPELPDEVRAVLMDPPECLIWYEGLPCFERSPNGGDRAGVCDAIEGYLALEPVATLELASRVYDENAAVTVEDGQPLTLTVYRGRPKP